MSVLISNFAHKHTKNEDILILCDRIYLSPFGYMHIRQHSKFILHYGNEFETFSHESLQPLYKRAVSVRTHIRKEIRNCCECITIPVLSNFVRIGKNWNTYIHSSD